MSKIGWHVYRDGVHVGCAVSNYFKNGQYAVSGVNGLFHENDPRTEFRFLCPTVKINTEVFRRVIQNLA